ncbi:MAG TPA: hypothetical protein VGC39_07645 [Candidatus Methylacidiphilales bacterium]
MPSNLTAVGAAPDQPRHIAIIALQNGKPDPDLAAAVEALLSEKPHLAVLERRQIDQLVQEATLDQVMSNPTQRPRLGHLLGLDYIVAIHRPAAEGEFTVDIIDAFSGQVVASRAAVSPGPDQLANGANSMLQDLKTPPQMTGQPRIAVLDFAPSANADADQLTQIQSLDQQVRERLTAFGLTLLDRTFTNEVVHEQTMRTDGLTTALKRAAPLLGADFVVSGEVEGNELRLHVLNTAAVQDAGTRSFPLTEERGTVRLGGDSFAWLQSLLRPGIRSVDWIEPTLQPEALQPFYKGLGEFQSGRYFDAIASFTQAYHLNDQFQQAYEWEARCYDALGLPELGTAERRFVAKDVADRGISRPVRIRQSEGITFVGLDGDGFSPLEIKHYEMAAIDALSDKIGADLHLPSDLALFRDEYDLFVGVENAEAANWASTPNFLTRWSLQGHLDRNSTGGISVSWTLSDTLAFVQKAVINTELSERPAIQKQQIADTLRRMMSGTKSAQYAFPKAVGFIPVAQAVTQMSQRGEQGNRALLQVVLQNPNEPSLWGNQTLDKNGYDKRGLQGFLDYALRDYLIAHLPPESLFRQWLELTQLARSIPFKEVGQFYSGNRIDVYARLDSFKRQHPGTITACFAEYMILYDHLSSLPAEELLSRLQNLRQGIQSAQGAEQVVGLDHFEGKIDHLIMLAKLANGQKDADLALPNKDFPHRLFPELFPNHACEFYSMDNWTCDEWRVAGNPEWLNQEDEAQAALLLLGRRSHDRVLDPAWLRAHPHSIAMLGFAIQNVYDVNHGTGRPILHPFDQEAERNDFKEVVAYCERGLGDDLAKSTSSIQENFFESQAQRFVCYLSNFAFGATIDDQRFDQIRSTLAASVEAARHRLGDIDFKKENLVWMSMPRLFPSSEYFNDVNTEDAYYLPDKLFVAEQTAGAQSWAASPVQDLAWLKVMDDPFFMKKLPPEALAKILQRYEPRMDELFAGKTLSEKDAAFVLDFALMLLHSHDFPDAEKWLRAVADQPESSPDQSSRFTEYQANALLHLGFVLMALGRESEAPPVLKRAIALTDNGFINVLERVYGHSSTNPLYGQESDGVRSMAMRFLEDVRLGLLPGELPSNVKRISITVPKLGYLKVDYYFRVPKGYDPQGKETHRILIIAPPLNGASPDYCLDQNSWAQFADKEGLFLVAPQFLALFNDRMNTFLNPQEWSGGSTLEVVDQLASQYRIEKNKLLLHGYGGGGDFVNRFARSAPDRVAAVSSHSTVGWDYYEVTPGLHPLDDLKNVPQLITCGEEDSFPVNSDDRLNRGIQYCTALKGSGAPFIWKAWPDTAYEINPNMERMAAAFLDYYAHHSLGPAQFIGDLRDWKYLSARDPRVGTIPERWRQSLPNRKTASLWGSPR